MRFRTRFAPSPTGLMHIGGVRTALYAYLVAHQNNGIFALRIEDTDRNRFVPSAVEDITLNLKWLGLNFDGEPIIQSQRKQIYQKYAKQLVSTGAAYEQEGAIWFKVPREGEVKFTDLVGNREIVFDLADQKDFVILKSDGFPTYHLAHIVDDHLMETNPVIRGDEWLSSIPKHILLFRALGWDVPPYAHLPLIVGTDRSKLSKRHGAKAVSEFRRDGFLPEAILNYMALLGWTPPADKEIISLREMIKVFDLKDVHITAAVFDITKLEWMNGEYIRMMEDSELAKRLQDFLVDSPRFAGEAGHPQKDKIVPVVPLVKERIKKLSDFIPLTDFLWEKPEYDETQYQKLNIPGLAPRNGAGKNRRRLFSRGLENQKEVLEEILKKLESMEKPWKAEIFEKTFRNLADQLGIKAGDMFQLIRIAISGQSVTPPLFESIQILGEDEALIRTKEALDFVSKTSIA